VLRRETVRDLRSGCFVESARSEWIEMQNALVDVGYNEHDKTVSAMPPYWLMYDLERYLLCVGHHSTTESDQENDESEDMFDSRKVRLAKWRRLVAARTPLMAREIMRKEMGYLLAQKNDLQMDWGNAEREDDSRARYLTNANASIECFLRQCLPRE
jgi:hypothetical protein